MRAGCASRSGCRSCPSLTGDRSHDHRIPCRCSKAGARPRDLADGRGRRLRRAELRHLPANPLARMGGGIAAADVGDRWDRQHLRGVAGGPVRPQGHHGGERPAGAAVFGVMAFVDDPGWLIAWAFLSALVESPFLAASAAAIPNLVDDEHIGWANGLVTLGTNAGIVVGPLVGGVLVATIGPGPVFALNAVSFVVSAALVWSVTGSFSGRRDDASEHAGVWAGNRFLTRERVLRAVALAWIPLE